jgi:hypothetical protein
MWYDDEERNDMEVTGMTDKRRVNWSYPYELLITLQKDDRVVFTVDGPVYNTRLSIKISTQPKPKKREGLPSVEAVGLAVPVSI